MDKPMIPEGAQAGKSVRSNYIGGYADVVQVYLERGWVSVLPLPPGQKSPPPTGFTGRGAQIPTPEQVENWRRERPDADVALALVVCDDWEYDLVGVDVDNYAKGSRPAGREMEAIAETEGRAGVRFPVTPSLEHRDDGSGIWVYLVPKGLFWRSQLGPGVELIHKGHRYIAAGRHKHWKDVNGQPLNEPPRPQDFAELPHALVLELMRDDNGTELHGLATPGAAKELLKELPTA